MAITRTRLGGVAALIVAAILLWHYTGVSTPSNNQSLLPIRTITAGGESLAVEVADTEAAREEGLSGRDGLAPHTGMLFVFPTPGQYGFWMKDMRFSLDIIYIDTHGRVVTVESNLSPQTYPQAFYPRAPISYVLEVPAGFAAAHSIEEGSVIGL